MTDPDKTLIAALLDRSGSMETSKGGHRGRLAGTDQRATPAAGPCQMTLAQFDTDYEVVYPPTPIDTVPDLVVEPRGRTALLDAVGRFVTEVGARLAAFPEHERPGHVICVIMTDGMENASHEWTWQAVKDLITGQRDQWQWTFLFIGANIDAVEVGARMGFSAENSITYDDSHYESTVAVMASAREMVRRTRGGEDAAFSPADREAALGGPRHPAG